MFIGVLLIFGLRELHFFLKSSAYFLHSDDKALSVETGG